MVINVCEHAEKDLCGKKHILQPLGGNILLSFGGKRETHFHNLENQKQKDNHNLLLQLSFERLQV